MGNKPEYGKSKTEPIKIEVPPAELIDQGNLIHENPDASKWIKRQVDNIESKDIHEIEVPKINMIPSKPVVEPQRRSLRMLNRLKKEHFH